MGESHDSQSLGRRVNELVLLWAKEGLIAGEWSDPEEGRARKEYTLTAAGRTYLAEISRAWRTLADHLEAFLNLGESDDSVCTGAA